jgi:hypothetical protein
MGGVKRIPSKNIYPAPGKLWVTLCSTHPTQDKADRLKPVVLNLRMENKSPGSPGLGRRAPYDHPDFTARAQPEFVRRFHKHGMARYGMV